MRMMTMKEIEMKKTNEIVKSLMMGGAMATLLLTMGCNTSEELQPRTDCEEVMIEGDAYCVWQQPIIIETGYTCPSSLRYSYEIEGRDALGGNLVVCSKYNTAPTTPIIQDIRRKLFSSQPEGDMGGDGDMTDDRDMGGDTDMPDGRTCDDVKADYAAEFATLDTSCTMDEDCADFNTTGCGITDALTGCNFPYNASADKSGLAALGQEFNALGCNVGEPDCQICAQKEVTCSDAGQCVFAPVVEPERTCEDIEEDYAAEFGALDTSCVTDMDCQPAGVNGCGITDNIASGCNYAVSTSADFSALTPLSTEYQAMRCDMDGPVCAACPGGPVTCDAGTCKMQPQVQRTCEDIKADYAAVYASFSRVCTVDADCAYAGTNVCGLASEVAGGCGISINKSEDRSELNVLGQEYDDLGCTRNDPACGPCQALPVSCDQGMCVTTM